MLSFLRNWFLPANLIWLLRPLAFVFGLYLLARIAFVFLYWNNFNELTFTDWLEFTWLSFRFDASAVFSINLIFIVLVLLPVSFGKHFFITLRWIFVGVNWLFLAINAADVPFYAFNSRRTSFDAIQFLASDFLNQLPQLIIHYWPLMMICFVVIYLLFRSFTQNPQKSPPQYFNGIVTILIWFTIGIGCIRNSFQLKPLMPSEAFTLSQAEAGHGVLNTPFLIFKTLELKPLPDSNWLTDQQMSHYFPSERILNSELLKGQNVVLIILESFATEYTGLEGNALSYTPFLDSLANSGIYFPHHFANGRTSRDALPSILASIPAWMDESFSTSQYATISIDGLGKRLQRTGYSTRFYHGGKNGTMSFDIFSKRAGFQSYIGLNEYPDHQDFDGNWGIFDEPFLQFMARDISNLPKPFGATVFTLSSHQPYTIPSKYKGKFRKGQLPIHEAIGYSDYALQKFFESARLEPWYQNTLFVLTADHTQAGVDPRYNSLPGTYDVPLIFFHPNRKLVADTGQWVQHLDIASSLSDLLGLHTTGINQLGESVFKIKRSDPIQYQDHVFYQFAKHQNLSWPGIDFDEGWNSNSRGNLSKDERLKMASRIQYFRQGLIHDRLFQ